MNNLTAHEKAQLTIKALQERKKKKLKAAKEADNFRSGGALNNVNRTNKRFY
ncbi:MAG: hypothetical protein Q8936_23340 [Bacillota bacterium]|nr:hypothetical protein [Bacillota bacterium]